VPIRNQFVSIQSTIGTTLDEGVSVTSATFGKATIRAVKIAAWYISAGQAQQNNLGLLAQLD
jgi:hypothetical protein